ncbi:TldD/PmbA family protein [Sulfuracidifex tepidarius]|uniref:Metalloprotease TldD/E C-terminal domain-containing protein n=1 Tax=Sulfuracidifex tepidarius TaxID=1294262 RepID=A0A510DYM8_9CREN|nr:TldD/PmbA family protein [Sulfuracidifex tepidarius]BBG25325.1 hypothetical protein IC006_2660 [Sulfuracidifex tepidarius]BBG28119.1 hypothetical protein IC007_2674 [Sulfuracidifex tepidarius]
MEKVVEKLNQTCDSYSLSITQTKSTMVKFADSKVTIVQNWNVSNVSLLLTRRNKFMTSTFSSVEEMERNLSSLNEKLGLLEPTELVPLISESDKIVRVRNTDERISSAITDPSPIVKVVLDSAESSLFGTLNLVETTRKLITSAGFDGEETRNYFVSYFRSIDRGRSGHWSTVSSKYSDSSLASTVKKSAEYASIDGEATLDEGRHDVVLSPSVFANLIEIIGYMSSAYNLMSSMSFLVKSKPGDNVASSKFSLNDIPKNDMVGSFNFDDEGTLTYNKPIIENGTLRTFLFNNSLAKKYNYKSTANAGWVEPRPWALEIGKGDVKEDSLLDGNLIFFNNNWYTRLQNYYEGQFSTVGRDAIIAFKDGKPIGRIKRARISDKLPCIINRIEGLSTDVYKQMWWEVEVPTISPFALIKNVMITKG